MPSPARADEMDRFNRERAAWLAGIDGVTVKLDSGETVKAECDYRDLKSKQRLRLKQTDDGGWLVVGL